MADPILNILSLADLSSHYTVFEPDQVLTDDQLNSVAAYLNDQERLTRIELLGVGIVGGLRVGQAANKVSVTRGVGVTSDADLLLMSADTVYASFKPYDKTAPRYAPLYVGDTMRTVFELVREGVTDAAAKPLSALPGPLAQMVVVMLMESCQNDTGLCTGTACDNLGKTAVDTPRLLLVSRTDAAALQSAPATANSAALALPELFAARPNLSAATATAGTLAAAYRNACVSIHNTLMDQLATLHAQLPALTGEVFGGDPAPAWRAKLVEHQTKFSGDVGIQYYYDFLKDVIDTWNELRDALFADDSLLCPDPKAFPKHLLLGDLTNPTQSRTGFFPSPILGDDRSQREHARSLARKLHALINTFIVPAAGTLPIAVTPSRTEIASLEDRAIPYYYDVRDDLPIQRDWNYRLSRRDAGASNFGYRARDYHGTAVAQNPLATQIGRYDFFRVEGHLGRNAADAKGQLESIIRARNLPFGVRAVLLHNDRKRIIVRPPIRYGDLHRFHYLLRNEVATYLGDSDNFNERFKATIDKALADKEFPDQQISTTANTRYSEVKTAIKGAQPAMASKRYVDYRADVSWKGAYTTVVNSSGSFKSTLGDIVRTDIATPFDGLAISNHPAWLDWLDTLIQAKDDREDDKLLFQNFIAAHPAFEHCGGVARGGTLVMLYDDSGKVVADGMLPYHWPEIAEDQPDEPDLKRPDFRLPILIDNSFKLKPPIDVLFTTKLTDFQAKIEPIWNTKLDMQKDYFRFFKDSVGALGEVLIPKRTGAAGLPAVFADDLLGLAVNDVQNKTDQIEKLRAVLSRGDITKEARDKGALQLQALQADLAKSIVGATQYIISAKVDVASGADGGKALAIIASSAGKVSDNSARKQLQEDLKAAQNQATGPHQLAVGNLMLTMGFGH